MATSLIRSMERDQVVKLLVLRGRDALVGATPDGFSVIISAFSICE
jgi:hypothetical protein